MEVRPVLRSWVYPGTLTGWNWGSTMGKGRALKGAYKMGPYYTRIHLPCWELGADHGFTDDRVDSTQHAFFLIVVTACLGINEGHF